MTAYEACMSPHDDQLRRAHQSRRASEHLLDGIRRALCDAGFMRDGDPYGHSDLADVIRQAGDAAREKVPAVDAEPACGYCGCTTPSAECTSCDHDEQPVPAALCGDPGPGACDLTNPCTLPLGHGMHRDQDGCSWPVRVGPVLDRTAIRSIIKFVTGATGDYPGPDAVDLLTDRLWAIHSGQVGEPKPPRGPAPCHIDHDSPGQVRQPPRWGCAARDRGERHPAHQWYSSTRGRVSCDGAPPFGVILHGDRVRVTYEADWVEVLSSGGRTVLAGDEPGSRCHNVIPDSATVEVIGRAGDGA